MNFHFLNNLTAAMKYYLSVLTSKSITSSSLLSSTSMLAISASIFYRAKFRNALLNAHPLDDILGSGQLKITCINLRFHGDQLFSIIQKKFFQEKFSLSEVS